MKSIVYLGLSEVIYIIGGDIASNLLTFVIDNQSYLEKTSLLTISFIEYLDLHEKSRQSI